MRARQVNIRRQRFLTEDTYLGDRTDTLSINRYIYARNNPLKYTDPSGNDVIIIPSLIGLAILGSAAIATIQASSRNSTSISNGISSIVNTGVESLKWIAINRAVNTVTTVVSIYDAASNVINSFTTVRQRKVTDYPVVNDSEIRRITDETYTNSIYAATNTAEDLSDAKGCEKDKVKQKDEANDDAIDNKTKISKWRQRPSKKSDPNSIYEQLNDDGTVKTRSFYDENGNQFDRQDFDHSHYSKELNKRLDEHEHFKSYNDKGQVNGEKVYPIPNGYSNMPSN